MEVSGNKNCTSVEEIESRLIRQSLKSPALHKWPCLLGKETAPSWEPALEGSWGPQRLPSAWRRGFLCPELFTMTSSLTTSSKSTQARCLQIGSPETRSGSKPCLSVNLFPCMVCHSVGKLPKSSGCVVPAVESGRGPCLQNTECQLNSREGLVCELVRGLFLLAHPGSSWGASQHLWRWVLCVRVCRGLWVRRGREIRCWDCGRWLWNAVYWQPVAATSVSTVTRVIY